MFGRLQTDCGYTPAEIRDMTMSDVNRLLTHWGKFPPLRDLVAAFIGFEVAVDDPDSTGDQPKHMTADDFMRLMAMTGGRFEGIT